MEFVLVFGTCIHQPTDTEQNICTTPSSLNILHQVLLLCLPIVSYLCEVEHVSTTDERSTSEWYSRTPFRGKEMFIKAGRLKVVQESYEVIWQ